MAEQEEVGCARPTGGPVGEEAMTETSEQHIVHKEERKIRQRQAFRLPGQVGAALFLPRRLHLCLSDRDFGGRRKSSRIRKIRRADSFDERGQRVRP